MEYRALTKEALNSIVIRAKREQVLEKGSPKAEITEYVTSEEVPEFNPVQKFLNSLPEWDGQNHIAQVFSRLPGITSEQLNYRRTRIFPWQSPQTIHNCVSKGKTNHPYIFYVAIQIIGKYLLFLNCFVSNSYTISREYDDIWGSRSYQPITLMTGTE